MNDLLNPEVPAKAVRETLIARVGVLRDLYRQNGVKPGAIALHSDAEFDEVCDIFAEHTAMKAALVEIECYLASAVTPSRANAVALAKVRTAMGQEGRAA